MSAIADRKARVTEANKIARRHFGEFQWRTVVLSVVVLMALFGVAASTLVGPLPLPVGVLVSGWLLYPAYICFHEAAHRNISRGRGRIVNEVVGTVLGSALGAPLVAHRREHLAHHGYTNRAGSDPDVDAFPDGRFGVRGALIMLATQYSHFCTTVWPDASRGERGRFVAETAGILGWRTLVIVAFGWQGAVLVLVCPVLGVMLLSYLLAYLVHYVPERLPEGRWIDTVSYDTGHLPRPLARLVDWFWMGHQVHGIHHLYPGVPFYRQQPVFDEIKELMVEFDAPVRPLWPAWGATKTA